jgi:uncharacterized membrane protein YfcA
MWPQARIVLAGAVVGLLGGVIGLGGAEFRLPLPIGIFDFASLDAVILNKATSLIVVATALPFRAGTVPLDQVSRIGRSFSTCWRAALPGPGLGPASRSG